ncbi:unnamed protein product, partial [Oppiella nova]
MKYLAIVALLSVATVLSADNTNNGVNGISFNDSILQGIHDGSHQHQGRHNEPHFHRHPFNHTMSNRTVHTRSLLPDPLHFADGIVQKALGVADQAAHAGLNIAGKAVDVKTGLAGGIAHTVLGGADNLFHHNMPHIPHHIPHIPIPHIPYVPHTGPSQSTDPTDAQYYGVRNSRDFTGKVVLVTVTNSGLAEGTIKLFSILGANLVITGTNGTYINQLAQSVQSYSPANLKPLPVVADLTKTADIQNLFTQTVQTFGKLDVLVNFANSYALLNITDPNLMASWDQTFQNDLRSTAELIQHAVPLLEQTNGSITNVATIAGVAPVAVELAYSTAKAGTEHLIKILALELGSKQIRVNTVNVGAITPDGQPDGNPILALMQSKAPLARLGVPLDVAK